MGSAIYKNESTFHFKSPANQSVFDKDNAAKQSDRRRRVAVQIYICPIFHACPVGRRPKFDPIPKLFYVRITTLEIHQHGLRLTGRVCPSTTSLGASTAENRSREVTYNEHTQHDNIIYPGKHRKLR